ncbi:hypothetical protein GCM10009838_63500 [Catenulispora subtropica]|uniref:Uncharacterized protein n=1 Tax=Catenulispora subtropica TaxID=450798 RepID=A0ABP5E4B5_9ACTN
MTAPSVLTLISPFLGTSLIPGFTPVFPASGQEPGGGLAPAAGGAEDEGALVGGFVGAADFDEASAVAGVVGAVGDEAAADGGVPVDDEEFPDGETAPVVRGRAPAASEAGELLPQPVPATSVKSTITTAMPADGVRDTGRTYHREKADFIRTLPYPARDGWSAGRPYRRLPQSGRRQPGVGGVGGTLLLDHDLFHQLT